MATDDGQNPGLGMPTSAPPTADLGVPRVAGTGDGLAMPGTPTTVPHDGLAIPGTPTAVAHDGLAMPGTAAPQPQIQDDWDLESNLGALQEWIAWATRGRPLHEGGHLRLLGFGLTPDAALARHRHERLHLEIDDWRSGGGENSVWAEQALERDDAFAELAALTATPDRWTEYVTSVRSARMKGLEEQLESKWSPYWKPPTGDMEIDPGEWRAITLDAQTTHDGLFGLYVTPEFLEGYRSRLQEGGVTFSGTVIKMPWGDSILGIEGLPRSMKAHEASIVGARFVQTMYQVGGTLRAMAGERAANLADAAIEVAESGEDAAIGFWRVLWRGGDKELRLGANTKVHSLEQLLGAVDGDGGQLEAVLRGGLLEAWLTDAVDQPELAEHAPKGGGINPAETAEQFLWRVGERRLVVGKTAYSVPKQVQTALENGKEAQIGGITKALADGRISAWLRLAQDHALLADKIDKIASEKAARAPSADRLLWALGSAVYRFASQKPTTPRELVLVAGGDPATILMDLRTGRLGTWLDRAIDRKDLARHAPYGNDVTLRAAEDFLWRLGEKRLLLRTDLGPSTVPELERLMLDRKSREAFETAFQSGRVAAWLRLAHADEDAGRRADPSSSPFPPDVDPGWIWFWRQGHKEFSLGDISLSKPSEILLLADSMKKVIGLCKAPAFAHWLREAHEMGERADLADQHRSEGRVEHGAYLLLWGFGHARLPLGKGSLSKKADLLEALDRRDPELVQVLNDGKLAAWMSIRLAVQLSDMLPSADPWLRLNVAGWTLGAKSAWIGTVRAESLDDFVARLDMDAFQDEAVKELAQGGFLGAWIGTEDATQVAQDWDSLSHPQEHLARALGRAKPTMKVQPKKRELGRIREEVGFPIELTIRNGSTVGTGFVRFESHSDVFTFPANLAIGPGKKRKVQLEYRAALGSTARSVKERFTVLLDDRPVRITVTGEGGVHPVQFLQAAGVGAALTAGVVAVSRWLVGVTIGDYVYPPNALGGLPAGDTEAAVMIGGWGMAAALVLVTAFLWRFGPDGAERRRNPRDSSLAWAVVPLVLLALLGGTVLVARAGVRNDLLEAEEEEARLALEVEAAAGASQVAEEQLIIGLEALLESNWGDALNRLGPVVSGPGLYGDLKDLAQVACQEAGEGFVGRPLGKDLFLVALENAQAIPKECGGAQTRDRAAVQYLDRLLSGGRVRGDGTPDSRKLAYSALLGQLFGTSGNRWPQPPDRRRLAAALIKETGGKFGVGASQRRNYEEGLIFKDHFQVNMTVETLEWVPSVGVTLTVLVNVTGDKTSVPAKCKPVLVMGGNEIWPKKVTGCPNQFGGSSRFTVLYRTQSPPDLTGALVYKSGYNDFPPFQFTMGTYTGGSVVTPDKPPRPLR